MSEQMTFDLRSAAPTSVLAVGLMSGTSQDGVDVALIDTDGEKIAQFGPTACRPYSTAERALLRCATEVAANLTERSPWPDIVAEAEQLINDAHAEAVETFLAANALEPVNVAAVGFHGQTLLHCPDRGFTLQIGNGPKLAVRLGIPVVYDFRTADVSAGGQGAPLAPAFHRALAGKINRDPPIAVLNLGGVANLTYVDGDELIACDTGPGNALLDDFLRLSTGDPLDTDGRKAAAGSVDEPMVERLLRHPFFALPPPKSLDRNEFHSWVGEALDAIGVENGAATLTALTAAAAARIVPHAARARDLDPCRRRRAQSDFDPDARRAASAGARRNRPCCRLVDRFAGGAGFRFSRGAQLAWPADHVSRNDRRAAPHDGRSAGEAMSERMRAPMW